MSKASLEVLSRDEIELIHATSLRILSEIGFKVESPAVVEMLSKAGAQLDDDGVTVHIDERFVSEALRTAPRSVRICSRAGKDYTIPNEGVQLMSTDGQPAAILDVETGSRRPSTLKDATDLAVLADALSEVDFIWPPVVATDMPPEKSSYYEFLVSITNSGKHIQHAAASEDEASFQIEVASAIMGSQDELRERPIISDVCTPISPLRYDKGEVEGMVLLARHGIPIVQLSMGIAGTVTPASVAGTLAVVNAENLFGLTLTQVTSPGAPSIYSSFSGVADLRSGVFLCGTPEAVLMDVGAIQMAKSYGLPSCAGGPANAARSLSVEAGYQTAMTAMASLLAGADLMVGLGGLDRSGMISYEKLVMDCELWRWLKRLRSGISVDGASLGFDAVKRQGPGGTFLSDPHTLTYMRRDIMIPQVTSYHSPGEPHRGRDELLEHAKRRVKEILSTHKPPLLEREVAAKVGAIAKRYGIVHKDGSQVFRHR